MSDPETTRWRAWWHRWSPFSAWFRAEWTQDSGWRVVTDWPWRRTS